MDEIDVAQQNEELFRQAALKTHFAGRQDTTLMTNDYEMGPASCGSGTPSHHKMCCACGAEIEPARLEAIPNVIRCVDCQARKERRDRRGIV